MKHPAKNEVFKHLWKETEPRRRSERLRNSSGSQTADPNGNESDSDSSPESNFPTPRSSGARRSKSSNGNGSNHSTTSRRSTRQKSIEISVNDAESFNDSKPLSRAPRSNVFNAVGLKQSTPPQRSDPSSVNDSQLLPIFSNPPRRPLFDISAPIVAPKQNFHPDTPFKDEWIFTLSKTCMNILVTNTHDQDGPPTSFKWIEDLVIDDTVPVIDLDFTPGCTCDVECEIMPGLNCDCMGAHGSHNNEYGSPYNEFGCVRFNPRDMAIYECNLNCACCINCPNRITQRVPNIRFEIFKCDNRKGWGVRTLDKLQKGQFYLGELITIEQAKSRENYMYLFDLDFFGLVCLILGKENSKYVIDASRYGNISRLYNHSCEPNMASYTVFKDTHDPSRHELALFCARDIEAGEELTYDYAGYLNSARAKKSCPTDHQEKCLCGSCQCCGVVPLFRSFGV